VIVLIVVLAGAAAVLHALRGPGPARDQGSAGRPGTVSSAGGATATPRPQGFPPRLLATSLGTLDSPVQDAAGAAVGPARVLLAAGLTAADTSRADVVAVTGGHERVLGRLPASLHDAAAACIGGSLYLFGGGDGVRQLDQILRVDPRTGTTRRVGRLPVPSSDQAGTAIGGTAYIVGGYDGSSWLDTILAWRPGHPARVVGRLPTGLRYAAITAVGGRLIIAGGSTPDGSASALVQQFDPATGRIDVIGRLPAPTTHAAAATIGGVAYVIGGRGSALDTPVARILAVDPVARRVAVAGALPTPLSDLTAIGLAGRIVTIGGRSPGGTVATIASLAPATTASAPRTTTAGSATSVATPPENVYAFDAPGDMSPAVRGVPYRIYVPNSQSDTVDVIDPRTYRVIDHFAVGGLPQHVVPSWDLKTLYVTNDTGNSLTPIDPRTGRSGPPIAVDDPYNMYFTPDGRSAIIVAERNARLDFRDPHTMALQQRVSVPCRGVDHMDFSADGSYLIASCEFSGQVVKVDLLHRNVAGTLRLGTGADMPQDVKLSPDGRVFYVADMMAGGVWKVDGVSLRILGFVRTGAGAHGLYPSRDARSLYVSNRAAGTISVISFATGRVIRTWTIPGGGSPDMGGVSPDGKVLWLSGRNDGVVYAIDTHDGRLIAKIPVGKGPHGLAVWPQPGRYSLGHTGILR
jgi:YVTN family beta-propeller protein